MCRRFSMRIRLFTSIATCLLASGLSGCRVQSTLVTPSLAPLTYATPGETLEFRALTPMYIVFYRTSPCAEPYYLVEPNKPARCKIRSGVSGYFEYYFETTKPTDGKFLFAKSCQYCQVVAVGVGNSSSAGSSQPGGSSDSGKSADSKSNSNTSAGSGRPYPPLPVSCDSDTQTAEVEDSWIQNGVQAQDKIAWIPMNGAQSVTVTMPSGICSGGQNGVFTAQDACTVTGTPGTYNYSVKLDQCANPGKGTLKINTSPSAP
jgi:hypothetical protein